MAFSDLKDLQVIHIIIDHRLTTSTLTDHGENLAYGCSSKSHYDITAAQATRDW